MIKLFEPLTIKGVTLRNRVVMSPMVQYSARDGFATDWHLVHYGSRAAGGTGLIIQEATAVSPEGRITPGDLGIYLDAHIEKYREITSFIHGQGAVAGIQLAHGGRKAACSAPWDGGKQLDRSGSGWQTVAPSAIAFQPGEFDPVALDEQGIQTIISAFRNAAARAVEAGFKVIEIHAAHGYLIHEFLSPLSNHRQDSYGGSFENRTRFLLHIVREVQEALQNKAPLFVRISATDWAEGGWDIEEAVKLARLLSNLGVDLIDCSSGGLVPYAVIPLKPGYQVPFSERIRKESGIMTGAVGLITEASQAEEILQKEQADLIFLARELLRNPYFPLKAAYDLRAQISWPNQYLRAKF